MHGSPTSPTLRLVLADLGATDGKALFKTAVRELVALDVWRLEASEQPRRMRRRPRRRLDLVRGLGRVPGSPVLAGADREIAGVRNQEQGGREVREIAAVARHLGGHPAVRARVLAAALEELEAAGLVTLQERALLGIRRRPVHVRTPAGDALLATEEPRRTAARHPGRDRSRDDGDDAWSDDASVDSSFDSAFDPAFDSAFDSGFADGGGGGDGGGGDGGGGN